jgi:hypothetical protein
VFSPFGLGNDTADAADNRRGAVSARQAAHLREVADKVARGGLSAAQIAALLVGLFAGPGVAAAIGQTVALDDSVKSALVAAGAVTSCGFIVGFFFYLRSDGVRRRGIDRDPYARALWDDVAEGRVVARDGTLVWDGEHYAPRAAGATLFTRAHAGPVQVYTLAAPPGSYRLYALPRSGLVTSVEPVGAGVDRAAYAQALASAMRLDLTAPLDPRARRLSGAAQARGEAHFERGDDGRTYWIGVLDVAGATFDVPLAAVAAVVPGTTLHVWFVEEHTGRKLLRVEPTP